MIKKYSIQIFLFGISIFNYAYSQSITFEKMYGGSGIEEGYFVRQTIDAGYIITGNTNSYGAGDYDVYLIKTDSLGNILWSKTYGDSAGDYGRCVQPTIDEGYIIVGGTNSYANGINQAYIIKTNDKGDTSWTRTYGYPYSAWTRFVQQTTDSGFIATGDFGGNSVSDVLLLKLNAFGDTIWSRKYKGIGNNSMCWGVGVYQTLDGGFIIAANEYNGLDTSIGNILLIKTNNNGDTIWTRSYKGLNHANCRGVKLTSDGGYIVIGNTSGYLFLLKTDSLGNTSPSSGGWEKLFLYPNTLSEGSSIEYVNDGGYIISALTDMFNPNYIDSWLLRVTSTGDTMWTKTFPTNTLLGGRYAHQVKDGGFILGASIRKSYDDYDFYLVKTDSNGNSPVSIKEISKTEKILLYPNPFDKTAKLKIISSQNYNNIKLNIFSLLGIKVGNTVSITENEITVERNNFPSGMYFYQLTDNGKIIGQGKFIIE